MYCCGSYQIRILDTKVFSEAEPFLKIEIHLIRIYYFAMACQCRRAAVLVCAHVYRTHAHEVLQHVTLLVVRLGF